MDIRTGEMMRSEQYKPTREQFILIYINLY